jgi:hypothetical protein
MFKSISSRSPHLLSAAMLSALLTLTTHTWAQTGDLMGV